MSPSPHPLNEPNLRSLAADSGWRTHSPGSQFQSQPDVRPQAIRSPLAVHFGDRDRTFIGKATEPRRARRGAFSPPCFSRTSEYPGPPELLLHIDRLPARHLSTPPPSPSAPFKRKTIPLPRRLIPQMRCSGVCPAVGGADQPFCPSYIFLIPN